MDLEGKVAIVTGSSRGLGKAMALAFARAGAAVAVAARTEEPHPRVKGTIHQTVEEIKAFGGRVIAVKCDVAIDEDIHRLAEETLKEFGQVDILVHNAAALMRGSIADLTLQRWDIMWKVNCRALFALAKEVLPSMQALGGGHILDVAPALRLPDPVSPSAEGQRGGARTAGLLKQWASQLAMTMAEELAPYNIAVNCLHPAGARNTEGMQVVAGGNYGHTSPQLFADAALAIVTKDPSSYTGRTLTDEQVLRDEGVQDFSQYLETPEATEPDRY